MANHQALEKMANLLRVTLYLQGKISVVPDMTGRDEALVTGLSLNQDGVCPSFHSTEQFRIQLQSPEAKTSFYKHVRSSRHPHTRRVKKNELSRILLKGGMPSCGLSIEIRLLASTFQETVIDMF